MSAAAAATRVATERLSRLSVLLRVGHGDAVVGRRVDTALRESYEGANVHAWARLRHLRLVRQPDGDNTGELLESAPSAGRGKRGLCGHRLAPGDVLMLRRDLAEALVRRGLEAAPPAPQSAPSWLRPDIIRFVSDTIAVISKPAGVPVQGGSGIKAGVSVDDALPKLAQMVSATRGVDGANAAAGAGNRLSTTRPSLRLVHRLDRDVGGVLLLARTRGAAATLTAAFRDGVVHKTYVALVAGSLPAGVPATGVITAPVVSAEYTASGTVSDASVQTARTSYTAHVLPAPSGRHDAGVGAGGGPLTLLFMQPLTGRTHQLRQHVLHLFKGMAGIIGDVRYGAKMSAQMRAVLGLPPIVGTAPSGSGSGTGSSNPYDAPITRRRKSRTPLMLHSVKVELPAVLLHSLEEEQRPCLTTPQEKGRSSRSARAQRAGGGQPLIVRDELPENMAALLRARGWTGPPCAARPASGVPPLAPPGASVVRVARRPKSRQRLI